MELAFEGVVVEWRGPAPYFFVRLPDDEAAEVDEIRNEVTYGWGVVPVTATIGDTEFTTSLFPKDGGYLLPLKDKVRRAEGISEGSTVSIRMAV